MDSSEKAGLLVGLFISAASVPVKPLILQLNSDFNRVKQLRFNDQARMFYYHASSWAPFHQE
jgi:hypothetical protein